jgi:hypothetical protein
MVEILPIKELRDEDALIFGSLNVSLGKLAQVGLPIGKGFAITAPNFHLKTILEQYDLGSKEVFEQSLTLIRKDIEDTPVPSELLKELGKSKNFFVGGQEVNSIGRLWIILLNMWLNTIKQRLWKDGFYPGVTENLDAVVVTVVEKVRAFGTASYEAQLSEVVVQTQGNIEPSDLKKLDEVVKEANKKLFIPQTYDWVLDQGIKLVGVKPYTPNVILNGREVLWTSRVKLDQNDNKKRSVVKVFFDLSDGFTVEKDIDGVYISSEKIFDLNHPQNSFEELVFKLVEVATAFPEVPVLMKLADMSEGMGKVRGALRLIHQKSLLNPLTEAILFSRNKKNLDNIHVVVPFVRGASELMQVKRELASQELRRKKSFQIWMEVATPENILQLEDYLIVGLDGVVLNLDELIAHLNGFDHTAADLAFYKNEVAGLLKFLDQDLKILHKARIPFIATGTISLYPEVLNFLVEKGVYGIVVERFEAHSARDHLYQAEKRMILRKTA